MKKGRSIFSNKRLFGFSSLLAVYVSFVCLIIALCDWHLIELLLSRTFDIPKSIRFTFLFVNLWMISLFILGLSVFRAQKKFQNILLRLKNVCEKNINGHNENKIHYRKNDPFNFFAKTFNTFIHERLRRKKNLILKGEMLQSQLDALPESLSNEDFDSFLNELKKYHIN